MMKPLTTPLERICSDSRHLPGILFNSNGRNGERSRANVCVLFIAYAYE